jgi:L-ascorbate metabolism protein UlaG (beta-lactamase superfamily)
MPKQKLFDTFALINTWFLFFSFFFSKLEHLIISFGHHHHLDHHLAPQLGFGPSFLVYTLSTRISP